MPPALGGDPENGRLLLRQFGCGTCHAIPGVAAARGKSGRRSTASARRVYLAGVLPNTPENMARWIRAPQTVDPRTAMPDLASPRRTRATWSLTCTRCDDERAAASSCSLALARGGAGAGASCSTRASTTSPPPTSTCAPTLLAARHRLARSRSSGTRARIAVAAARRPGAARARARALPRALRAMPRRARRRAGAVRARPDAARRATSRTPRASGAPAELFWVVKNGIKMTGMPAWEFRLADDDLWAVVAFLRELPRSRPRNTARCSRAARAPQRARSRRSSTRSRSAARRAIAAVRLRDLPSHPRHRRRQRAGRPAARRASRRARHARRRAAEHAARTWCAGCARRRRSTPRTAMPDLGVTERDARDIAAYLATLK